MELFGLSKNLNVQMVFYHCSETRKEIEGMENKNKVEDQAPANSNQALSESNSNNASKDTKNFKTKTRTERQVAKSADITHYFHWLPN